jgi:hypothetical protein
MKLKLDENGHVVVSDGKPVYVHEDGKEIAFDAAATVATISRLNGEAKTHRERAEAAEQHAKAFEGIDDAEAARKALEVLKNLDDKKLVDAGEVERVKAEAVKAYESRLTEQSKRYAEELQGMQKERDALQGTLYEERIGGAFNSSKLIAEKLTIPGDIAKAAFGSAFKIEDGKTVAYDASGNKIFSRERPGEIAGFDEALATLIEAYPHRDQILRGSGASGSGAQGGGNGSGIGSKTLNRSAFDALPPDKQMAHIKSGGQVSD